MGLKLFFIIAIITGLIVIKKQLTGFMTVFPMVGLIACYECRHSLWTICRQTSIIMIAVASMLMTMRLTQPLMGYAWSLAPGWLVILAILYATNRLETLNPKTQPLATAS